MKIQRETATTEVTQLKAYINDVISLLALPATWSGDKPAQIGATLLDALVGMLRLDFAYLRLVESLDGGRPIEILRTPGPRDTPLPPEDVRRALSALPMSQSTPSRSANPLGGGEVSVVSRRLGIHLDLGSLVVASVRPDFPTQTEKLLIDIAANEAVMGLQDALRLIEQRRLAEAEHSVAGKALRKIEERWQAVFENSAIGVALTDQSGRFMATNSAYQRMLGYTGEELGRLTFLELTREDYRELNWQLITELFEGKRRQFQIEKQYRRKDGSWIWVSNNVSLVPGTETMPRFVMALAEDITERKHAEEKLRRSEARIRRLVDANIIGIFIWNFGGHLLEANEAFLRMLDYGRMDLLSDRMRWTELTPPEWRERDAQAIEELRTTGIAQPYEKEYFRKDGSRVAVLIGGATFPENANEGVAFVMDITKRKKAELALARSKEHLRQVIDTIPVQIWSGTADGAIDFCNLRWRTELGFTPEQLKGDGWRRMIHPDDQDHVWTAWQDSVVNGTLYEQQERHRMTTGEYRWFLSRAVPLRDEHGKITRWFGGNTDIDDQKKADDALRRSEERWRGVFHNSRVGVALQDSRLRYVDANAAFINLVGYSLEELRAMDCLQITYAEDRERYKTCIDELLHGKLEHFELEKRYVRKDGRLIWARLNGSIVDPNGSKLWVVIEEDITDRKRLHDQLQRERDRLRLLLDLSNTFVSKLNIRDFFDALALRLREIEGWEYSAILLPDSNNRLRVELVAGPKSALKKGMSLPIAGTIAGDVYHSQKPEFFRLADLRPVGTDYADLIEWRTVAIKEGMEVGCNLPLVDGGAVLGVLAFHSEKHLEVAQSDLGFLQELANLVAIALHNALRYGELSEAHERLTYEKSYIEDQIRAEFGFKSIVGGSSALRNVLKQVNAVAPTDTTVLILGETGTGKELVARAIHERSPRKARSFVKVDCAAIPAALMESELFGHEKGAFTGATAQKLGRFEIADQGTIFLDEVGDVPMELQTKLLRVLQDHAFERLGSNRTISVNVRIISATHRNLEEMVEKGTFREDLYYRLKVFPIVIPPLRDRPSDIPALVIHYVDTYARRMKKEVPTVLPATMDAFMRYPWPGNVRELQHFIERSVVLTSGRHLQAPLSELKRFSERTRVRARTGRTLEQVERDAILQALEESNWVIGGPSGAAAKLGLKRTTLASRIEKLGISRRR